MNKTAVVKGAGQFTAPAVLVVGASLSTMAIVGNGHTQPAAQAPPPSVAASPNSPTTSSSTSAAPPRSVPARSPHPSPRPTSIEVRVVAAGREVAGSTGSAGGRTAWDSSGGGGPTVQPSQPSRPSAPPATDRPSPGVRATVRLSHPLGVLPDVGVDLTVRRAR